jgi:hypothetical protein
MVSTAEEMEGRGVGRREDLIAVERGCAGGLCGSYASWRYYFIGPRTLS